LRIGLSTLLFPNHALEDAVRICTELGAEWVEIIWDFPHFAPGVKADLREIKRTIEESGVGVSVHASFWDVNPSTVLPDLRRLTVRRIGAGIRLCARLGGSITVVHVGKCHIPEVKWMWEEAGRSYERTMGEICPLARKLGVRIAVENGSSPFGPYATLDELPNLLGKFDVGICLDVGHAHLVEKKGSRSSPDRRVAEKIRRLGGEIIHVHIHDNLGVRDDHLVPGDGEIDFGLVGGALRRIGYSGAVVVELFNPRSPVATGRRGLLAVRKIFGLERAGRRKG